jgi:hypothetical protein
MLAAAFHPLRTLRLVDMIRGCWRSRQYRYGHITFCGFGSLGLLGLGMLGYLVWAEGRGLLTWQGVGVVVLTQVLPACAFLCAVGLLFLWRWSRKKDAVQAFDRRSESLPPLE